MQIVGQVEIDDYCQKILELRFPNVPKWRDIREVTGKEILERCGGTVELISGGFPCQPFSVAGKRRGKDDNRYLWPEMLRVISEVKPAFVLGENVSGIVRNGLDTVLDDLEAEGYSTLTLVFPSHAVGTPHKRDRVWVVAYSSSIGRNIGSSFKREHENNILEVGQSSEDKQQRSFGEHRSSEIRKDVADTISNSERTTQRSGTLQRTDNEQNDWDEIRNDFRNSGKAQRRFWEFEPGVGRVAHGIANRVDRLKLLGNGQVVQVVEWIGKRIMDFDRKFF